MRFFRSLLTFILSAALCFSFSFGCCEDHSDYGFVLENNTDYQTDLYPYVVHGKTADWYIAKADIEMMGLEAICEGLDQVMEDQELDFADAKAVLSEYLIEDVPIIKICTDFSNHTELSAVAAAYYNESVDFIKVFHSWDYVKASLLHEYVHYLTFACAKNSIRYGFWSEGVAEYISRFICRNRMSRSVNMGMPPETVAAESSRGIIDPEDGSVDAKKVYLITAEMYHRGDGIGVTYYSASNEVLQRTEQMQQRLKPNQLSYFEAACMTAYLVETYGEEYVFSHWNIDLEHNEGIFGKSFPELYQSWAAWNTQQCNQLGLDTQ